VAAQWLNRLDGTEAEASPSPASPILYPELQNHIVEPTDHPTREVLYSPLQNDLARIIDPTGETYSNLGQAFDFFNDDLFEGKLPRPLITLNCSGNVRAIYRHERFSTAPDPSSGQFERIDEIAMNPQFFLYKPLEDTLSHLLHEAVHLQQKHFGEPSRNGYHNAEFAKSMEAVGLITSDTGKPGGKRTGQRMSHHIKEDGAFARACRELTEVHGFVLTYGDPKGDPRKTVPGEPKLPKPNSRITYICTTPACPVELEGKPGASFVRVSCVDCNSLLIDKKALSSRM
jgi:hypothetical protein